MDLISLWWHKSMGQCSNTKITRHKILIVKLKRNQIMLADIISLISNSFKCLTFLGSITLPTPTEHITFIWS